ncbi:MAG: serine/threonine-protein phosphatase [Actinomycetota bacterium]|nr:serine/threonine-protein phosphatase [Actinomycetota bacterium]
MSDIGTDCPSCSGPIVIGDAFCESCGATLAEGAPDAGAAESPTAEMPVPTVPPATVPPATTVSPAPGALPACRQCGGDVLDDGFCSQCGQKAPTVRDHWQESPVDWVAGVCDRGIAHARNEDAMALAGLADRSLAVLVVCDGVTSAPDSDRAALAAARDACATLVGTPSAASQAAAAIISHWSAALVRACADGNAAAVGVARSLGNPSEPPSCTFVAAVVQGSVVTIGWCGDSRAYWLPDEGEAVQLMRDHSLGTEMMRDGMSRAQAEADPTSHTITRWLGADSFDPTPEVNSFQVASPGWLLVCSDGLWNYASLPVALQSLVHEHVAGGRTTPLAIADALVVWANEQGGHDNITAALARVQPSLR